MLNILLTGATGFLGKNFIKNNTSFQINSVSLRNVSVNEIDFTGIDTVLHLAALVHQMNGAPEDEYFKINHGLTIQLADKAKQCGVPHFIFMSSSKVFGESTESGKPFNENSQCNPEDAYGKSKLKAESDLIKLNDHNFIVTILRIPLVYGEGVKGNMVNLIKLINTFSFIPLSGINNRRSMLYVGNLNAFLQQVIELKPSGILISTDSTPVSTTEIIRFISHAAGKKIVLFKLPYFIFYLIGLIKPKIVHRLFSSFELSNDITNKKLNFVNPYSTEEGIKEMVSYYKKRQLNK